MSASPTSASLAFKPNFRSDIVSGFLVFLIALPLSLGIAMASNFPPIAGVLTAIVGGVCASFLGSSPLTIKGPAAGLIVIALGAVTELGNGDATLGYRRALATIVIAGAIQIGLALIRAGALGDFFPSAVVHGMLAAIGVIIVSKQAHVIVGVAPAAKKPLELLAEIPHSIANANPEVFFIGVLSLVLLFGLPLIPISWAKKIPGPMVVLVLAIPLGLAFDLEHFHTYSLLGHSYQIGPKFLVEIPGKLISALAPPDFSDVGSATSLKYITMFTLVGSIESLLSAKAVQTLDPLRRPIDLNRDLFATGCGNVVAGAIGGLPMISEIVRSSMNVNNGATSRYANFFHGVFLLVFAAVFPWLLHKIPLAALAGMLIYTGVRLASPSEFVRTFRIGAEQLLVFVTTLVVTLATDLLVGVGAGIVAEFLLQIRHGVPIRTVFNPSIEEEDSDGARVLRVRGSAVFSNFIGLQKRIVLAEKTKSPVVLDLCETNFVDHTVLERLHHLTEDWQRVGRTLVLRGLDEHTPLSAHSLAARRKRRP